MRVLPQLCIALASVALVATATSAKAEVGTPTFTGWPTVADAATPTIAPAVYSGEGGSVQQIGWNRYGRRYYSARPNFGGGFYYGPSYSYYRNPYHYRYYSNYPQYYGPRYGTYYRAPAYRYYRYW